VYNNLHWIFIHIEALLQPPRFNSPCTYQYICMYIVHLSLANFSIAIAYLIRLIFSTLLRGCEGATRLCALLWYQIARVHAPGCNAIILRHLSGSNHAQIRCRLLSWIDNIRCCLLCRICCILLRLCGQKLLWCCRHLHLLLLLLLLLLLRCLHCAIWGTWWGSTCRGRCTCRWCGCSGRSR